MSRKPATAHQYRRAIALVQVLAIQGSDEHIRQLCADWNIEPVEDRSEPPYRGQYYMNVWATIRQLAAAALRHARAQEEE